ncbi:hypothetical protein GCM10028798_00800 [Humibacter antri]
MPILEREVQILFDPAQYAALEAEAASENRSVAALVREAVDDWLARRKGDARSALDRLFSSGDEAPGLGPIDWAAEKDSYEGRGEDRRLMDTVEAMENAVIVDSAVVAYALGDSKPESDACRRFLIETTTGGRRAYASVATIQEVVHHRLRRTGDRVRASAEGQDTCATFTLLAFDHEIPDLSLDLIERLRRIRGRDAAHVATAIAHCIETIASPDPAFDDLPGIRRLDPLLAT